MQSTIKTILYVPLCMVLFFFSACSAFSQSVYAPLNNDYNDLIDRLAIKGYSGNIFTSVKPYLRKDIAQLADSISKDSTIHFSKVDRRNLQYLQNDNWEFSGAKDAGDSKHHFIGNLYKKKNDFYEINRKYFEFQLNPVAYFSYGKDMDSSGKKTTTY